MPARRAFLRSAIRVTICLITFLTSVCSVNHMYAQNPVRDITEQLSADADQGAIVDHLFQARKTASTTRALALHYSTISREQACRIQMALLKKMQAAGEKIVGWKMGGTKITKPGEKLDPVFGFMLASDKYQSGGIYPADRFANDTPIMEAEVGFWIGKDLPGPKVSRRQLEAAISGVGGTSELISARVRDVDGGLEAGLNLAIADGLSHGGFILPSQTVPLSEARFDTEIGSVKINEKVIATGHAKIMMEGDPLAAVLALANRLPQHGQHLRAGDVVIIGSMLESPPAGAGDHVDIEFSSFESLSIDFE